MTANTLIVNQDGNGEDSDMNDGTATMQIKLQLCWRMDTRKRLCPSLDGNERHAEEEHRPRETITWSNIDGGYNTFYAVGPRTL